MGTNRAMMPSRARLAFLSDHCHSCCRTGRLSTSWTARTLSPCPTQAKTYYQDDLVVCLLRGGFTRVEQTLLDGGRGEAVIRQRMEFQEVMRERFEEVVQRATGRRVIGFMSGNQQSPDMICEVFVLGPIDLVDEPAGSGDERA